MTKDRKTISLRILAVIVLLTCTGSLLYYFILSNKDVTHLLERKDSLTFKIYSQGKEIQMPPEKEKEYNQHIQRWSASLNAIGTIDINSYAPSILLTSDHLKINLQNKTTIISHRSDNTSVWSQRSRKPDPEDVKLRAFLDTIIQEQLSKESKAAKNEEL